MPQLGETVTEGTVAQWLKSVGEAVEKYESFVEISTDKVNAEVPSPVSGVIAQIIVAAGETVPIGAPIAVIDEVAVSVVGLPAGLVVAGEPGFAAESYVDAVPSLFGNGAASSGNGAALSGNGAQQSENGAGRNGHGAAASVAAPRRMSPAVRRLAREHKIDVATLRGTGDDGRVTARDVLAASVAIVSAGAPEAPRVTHAPQAPRNAAQAPDAPTIPPAAAETKPRAAAAATLPSAFTQPPGRSTYSEPVPGTLVTLSPARKLIARRMSESLATAPHAWTMVEVDVSKLLAWRNREKERFLREKGYPLTVLPFFLRAVVESLRAHPLLNSRFTDDGIVIERDVHVGIAIALDASLVVPVIRDADSLSISGLAVAAGKLIERARSGKLGADELGGGTFTVNNTGANGSVLSKPIINGGQAAIITMEAIVKRPVVIDDAIAIRQMLNVCLSLDHRVLDGAGAGAFLTDLKSRLEAMDGRGAL